jgi:hypothetical protein
MIHPQRTRLVARHRAPKLADSSGSRDSVCRRPGFRCGPILALLAGLLLLAGCSTYTARYAALRPDLADGRYDAALKIIEENRKGKDLLLYYLEKAMVLHYADRWRESNEVFQLAEDLAADLYTKSVSEGLFSLITSDNSISYRARPFEMAMIPYYRALNYIYLDQKEDALVEARKASLYLREYASLTRQALQEAGGEGDKKSEAKHGDSDAVELLSNNAFLHYFSGMLYEWDGEVNDAFIAYRNAADAYATTMRELDVQPPPALANDLVRAGERLGFMTEVEEIFAAHPDLFGQDNEDPDEGQVGSGALAAPEAPAPLAPAQETAPTEQVAPTRSSLQTTATGEVVLLLELGYIAHKEQQELNVPVLKGDNYNDNDAWARGLAVRTRPGWSAGKREIDYWLRVAVPEMVSDRPQVQSARVSAGLAGTHAVTVIADDLEGQAMLTFQDEYGTILLKTLVRGLAKYATKEAADDKGAVAGILANIFGAVTETADTRSWITLPNMIAVARLSLPVGVHDLRIDLLDAKGRVVTTEDISGVIVRQGDWRFVSRRVF